MKRLLLNIFHFYRDGFREMTVGRTLWIIILVKLFVFFVILRLIFFPDQLADMTDGEKAATVMEQLTS